MMTDPRVDYRAGPCLEKYRRLACGVASVDRLFLAILDPYRHDLDVDGRSFGPDLMMVVDMDRAAILDGGGGLPPQTYRPVRR